LRLGACCMLAGPALRSPCLKAISGSRKRCARTAFLACQRICAARRRSSELGLSSASACPTPGSSGGRSGTKISGFSLGSPVRAQTPIAPGFR
jgi:hypothetical protein